MGNKRRNKQDNMPEGCFFRKAPQIKGRVIPTNQGELDDNAGQ